MAEDRATLAAGGLLLLAAGAAWWLNREGAKDVAAWDWLSRFGAWIMGREPEPAAAVEVGLPVIVGGDAAPAGGLVYDASWQPPASAAPYLAAIETAERRYGIPHRLLARLLYQESGFRPDVIEGRTVSSAGAVGIAQIVPRWHPDARPLDPFHSIDYAGRYLSQLAARFGSWSLGLAAYNWGQGNLATYGFGAAPRETRNYVAQITADVPVA